MAAPAGNRAGGRMSGLAAGDVGVRAMTPEDAEAVAGLFAGVRDEGGGSGWDAAAIRAALAAGGFGAVA
ncbi:MAG: hypothetical protein RIM80_12570, partial [Alphaproteobacteria bacterium]